MKALGGSPASPAFLSPALEEAGFVHSAVSGSAVDGPGLRYVLFLAGCAFRCQYCHNPDSWRAQASQKKSLDEILLELGRYAGFLRFGGGLTVSGGEPLGQAAFVGRLFREVKARWGLHTALDTQGYLGVRLPDSWFDPLDLALLDIKHSTDEGHRALTAYPLGPSLAFARRLGQLGKRLWIRHVVVPGLTDGADHLERWADLLIDIEGIERIELLPFHQLGAAKWRELGLRYELEHIAPPTGERMDFLRALLRRRDLPVLMPD